MLPAHFMNRLFNVLVGGLRLPGVYHINIVVLHHRPGIPLYLIGVKDQDQRTAPAALVIAADVHEPVPGAVDVHCRQLPQLLPGKNDIVTVHQKIFFPFLEIFFLIFINLRYRASFYPVPSPARVPPVITVRRIIPAGFPIGTQENLLNFLLGNVTGRPAARLAGSALA